MYNEENKTILKELNTSINNIRGCLWHRENKRKNRVAK